MIILRIFSNQAGEIFEEAIGLEILGENRARQVRSYSFMLKLNENNFYKNMDEFMCCDFSRAPIENEH